MKRRLDKINILMADDDQDDRLLMKAALEEIKMPNVINFVEDGAELMDYLYQKGRFLGDKTIKPNLILLDINMPKMDGHEALFLIKSDPVLKSIPVIVLTTSKAEIDVTKTYDLGVNSYISKPDNFNELLKIAHEIDHYWFGIVELPKN